jgi:solute carrier family 13 (sodium-dependent dicarboxylate transporter), member 2/3/5
MTNSSAVAPSAQAVPPVPDGQERPFGRYRRAGAILSVLLPVMVWFAPLPLAATQKHAIAIGLFMILAWVTEILELGLTGLIGCYLFWALAVAKVDVAFSGFADDTAWLILGAMLLGTMAAKSGLARRVAYLVLLKVGATYSRLLLGLIITDFLLCFFIPSGTPRVVIMATIALGLIEAFGLGRGSNVGRGMFLILTYTATVFDKFIIGGASSIISRGAIERFGGVPVEYSRWLLAFLPCDIVMILIAWRLTLWLFPPENAALPGGVRFLRDELGKMGSWTPIEKKSLALMLVAIALWTTDFLHHISPAVIGVGVALLALLPVAGVLSVDDLRRLNYMQFFFVAATISLGKVLTATKGVEVLTKVMFGWITPLIGYHYLSTSVLYWTAFLYHIFLSSELAMLGTSMPLLMNYAVAHHLSPLALGMLWTFAASGKLFVYQSSVIVIGYAYGYFSTKDLFRMGLALSVVGFFLLLFVVSFYWPLIGVGR